MIQAREISKERVIGPISVSNIISGSGSGGVTLWGGYLSFVGGNVQEAGGGARGFPHRVYESEVHTARGRGLEKRGSGKDILGSRYSDNGDVH